MRWYFLRYACFYLAEFALVTIWPAHMVSTSIVTVASHTTAVVAYGGAFLSGLLNAWCALAHFRHRAFPWLTLITATVTVTYATLVLGDVLLHPVVVHGAANLGAVLFWSLVLSAHLTEYFAPSDVARLVRRMRVALWEEEPS